jgi:4-hydroxy-3-methylbut-2-en-1-yl diphosphate synthase IspG/GcpE
VPASTVPASIVAVAATPATSAPAVELVAAPQRVQNRNIPLTGDPHWVQNRIAVSPA